MAQKNKPRTYRRHEACRFPHSTKIQKIIIEEKSPMTAKMKSKPFRGETRDDWDKVRINIMRWCLRVKLACNWVNFKKLLLSTGEKPIVEDSGRDNFWGAIADGDEILIGQNILGRLLMELRQELNENRIKNLEIVEPLSIENFTLFNQKIPIIYAQKEEKKEVELPRQLNLFPEH
jgi:ribA/ribD-fused uncharacterized protein